MATDKLMYVGQKAFIERNGEVLVLFDQKQRLDFPGGKIQEGKIDVDTSLKREVLEETRLEIEVGNPFTTWSFELPPEHRNIGTVFLVGYRCTYLSGEIKLSGEHSSFRWVNNNTYRQLDNGSDHFKALEKYFDLEA